MPRSLCHGLLWMLLALSGGAVAFELPGWQQLVFEQRSFWVTARGVVTLSESADPGSPLQLEVNNYIGSNSEQIAITLRPDTAATVERWRLSRGRDERLKTHRYTDSEIERKRREPSGGASTDPPREWLVSSRMSLAVPAPAANGDKIVIAPHTLLALLPALRAHPDLADEYLIHTDLNFFRMAVEIAPHTHRLRSRFKVDGAQQEGERECQLLIVQTQALDNNPERNDLELMGMTGRIEIFIDLATGLPLLLRGDAPRVGRAELKLIEADSRAHAAVSLVGGATLQP